VKNLGYTTLDVLLLYFVYNLVSSIVSYPLGKLSDKIARKHLVLPGYLLYAFVYVGIAFTKDDLPTLGRPTTASFIALSSSSWYLIFLGKWNIT